MARTKSRGSTVFARVNAELKEDATQVLKELDLTMSDSINLFLKQIVIHGGIPFDITIKKD
ncbi:hypothetical protein BK126_26380 [Paenibacillus sp. FSL H7-0326]|uniref:type II toxin-antitoxin system RelB/DinJ family antitoxin n=1 Tax=Paenibacillus sp. FSL H7-0326 TaxID=1921144 RepID=UPI00096C4D2C|nr:hypothetical protein BK126_26380 [Paenibacillus sp. FSL H7-0326]